ncbi:MAG: hypothetical protein CME71_08645 [Halobacteriovorax sp.]|nr:hypothetical protein [Halobacteriovorax sp.]
MKLSILRKIVLSLIAAWFGIIAFNDFVVVPAVFTSLSNRVEAANLGMGLFSKLGSFEVVVATILFFCAGLVFKKFRTRRSAFLFLLGSSLLGFALMGKFYLTPKITELNLEKFSVREGSAQYEKANQKHQFYHGLYVKLDGTKMLLLVLGIFGSFRASRFDNEKVILIPLRRMK